MLKRVTFSANSDVIEKAHRIAISNHTTLAAEFRQWLEQYTSTPDIDLHELVSKMDYVRIGGPFSREEMNER